MDLIRYTLHRNRKNLKIIGWAAVGFILLFCILTVQLSTIQGQAPAKFPAAKPLPSTSRVTFEVQDDFRHSLKHAKRPASDSSRTSIQGDFLGGVRVSQASHTFPGSSGGVDSIAPPSPYPYPGNTYPNNAQHFAPDRSTSPNAIYPQQQPGVGETIYTESQAMPRSNYFGVGPDDVCDEWSGFCNCEQKMFTRRGEACSDKDCRFKRGRKSDDCGCGN